MSLSHRLSVPKKQRKFYSGKKKKHTLKTQVIFNPKLKQIVSIQIEDGRKHDLTIARKYLKEMVIYPCIMADLAYKGFHQIKSKLLIPIKKPKNLSLPQIAKQIKLNSNHRLMAIKSLDIWRCLSAPIKTYGLKLHHSFHLKAVHIKPSLSPVQAALT